MPVEVLDILRVVALSLFAGGTSFVGALISKYVKFSEDHVLFLTAFGAGILISAAIFEMIIVAEKVIGIFVALFLFLFVLGSIIFTVADILVERKGGGAGILLGIGLDTVPESFAIGASVASGTGLVIALLIGIQNLPEGIASYREMMSSPTKTAFKTDRKALGAIGIVSIMPVILGLVGLFYIPGNEIVIAITLALSAGGIFYVLFYDIEQ
jgi:ZIP family zinc transporter